MSAKEAWTPYGLEAIRIRYLRRRRILAILIALGLAGMWGFLMQTTTTTSQEIFVNGQKAGNGIQIDEPTPQKDGPVTVGIEAGRVTRADTGGEAAAASTPTVGAPVFSRAPPIPFQGYAFVYGPLLLLVLAGWFLAKKKGRHDQVNYGVYKGSMPLELVSHSMANHIFTTRWAKTSVFGKRRADHLPEGFAIERVPQEEA